MKKINKGMKTVKKNDFYKILSVKIFVVKETRCFCAENFGKKVVEILSEKCDEELIRKTIALKKAECLL
ncbi:MAG: hypothetical protein R6W70_10250 [bacterium]